MRKSLVVLVGLTLATLAVFALWPQIDGEVSRAFYGPAGFIGRTPPERAARDWEAEGATGAVTSGKSSRCAVVSNFAARALSEASRFASWRLAA